MKNKWSVQIICYAGIAFLVVLIGVFSFLRPIFLVQKPSDLTFKLIATGEKTKESSGNEVRISKIKVNQTKTLILEDYATNGWIMDKDILAAYNIDTPLSLINPLTNVRTLDVEFIKQRGSGMVELNIGQVNEVIDLYSNNDWVKETWHYEVPKEFMPALRMDLFLQLWGILTLIICGGLYLRRNAKK